MEIYEVHHDGRLHVFYDRKLYKEFLELGETPFRLTRIGAGPKGQTIVFGLTKKDKKKPGSVDAIKIYDKKINEYLEYDGTKTQIIENRQYIPHRSFTLVFDSSRKVVDVLFDGRSFKYGLSSIQVKRRVNPQAQKLPNYDHDVHFAPGQTVNN